MRLLCLTLAVAAAAQAATPPPRPLLPPPASPPAGSVTFGFDEATGCLHAPSATICRDGRIIQFTSPRQGVAPPPPAAPAHHHQHHHHAFTGLVGPSGVIGPSGLVG